MATVPVTFTAGATPVSGYQLDFSFTRSPAGAVATTGTVTMTDVTGQCGGNAETLATGTAVTALDFDAGLAALPSGVTCNLAFPLDPAAAPGTYAFVLGPTMEFTDTMGNTLPMGTGTFTNGAIVIQAVSAEFDATPAPGMRTLNGTVMTPGTETINVNNDLGDPGTTLTLSAAAADSSGTGTLSVSPANASVAQGAADAVFTVTCSSTIVESFTGTVTFTTNDPDDMEGTVVYNYTCNITNPAPEYDSVPAAGTPIVINDAVGGGGTTATVVVSNVGTLDLTATATGLSGVLAVAPTGQQTIAPAGMTTFTITCTAVAAGSTMQTLNIASNDSDEASNDYPVTCNGVAPEYNSVPAAGSTITIVDVAGDGMPSSQTLTVSNTGTGDLTVGAPTGLSGIFSIAPNTAQTIPPMGSVPYTISCNSVDAVNQTQTLTLTSNDADEGTNTYTIVCDATGAEITTTPASGGTITMAGPPGNPVTGSASVTNTGDAALTITGCMLGGTSPGSFTTPADQTIAAGGSGTLSTTCTAPAAGTVVTATLTCNTNDLSEPTINFTLSCQGLNVSIPTLGDYGKLLMIAMVLGLGLLGMALRRTA